MTRAEIKPDDAVLRSRRTFYTVSRNIRLNVPSEDLLAILKYESTCPNVPLCNKLNRIPGVSDTNYDGHFGPHIFFTLDRENDNRDTRNLVDSTITAFIDTSRYWRDRNK